MAKGSFYANPVWDDPAEGDEAVREKRLGWAAVLCSVIISVRCMWLQICCASRKLETCLASQILPNWL